MTVSIVIPSYGRWDLTHSLLLDIYKCFPQDTEVILVDDASPDKEVSDGLVWWKNGLLKDRLRTFINETNCGFLRTANFGISKANYEKVFLISTDVKILSKLAYEQSVACLDTPTNPLLVGARHIKFDTGWNTFGGKIFPYMEGWFLAFRKTEWLHYGGFDERFVPNDYEDVDISSTYLHNGGALVQIDEGLVTHLGGQSIGFSDKRRELTERNKIKFQEKWLGENK